MTAQTYLMESSQKWHLKTKEENSLNIFGDWSSFQLYRINKEIVNFIDSVNDIVEFYGFQQDKDIISKYYDYKHQTWNEDYIDEVTQILKRTFFFSRFEERDIRVIINVIFNHYKTLFSNKINYLLILFYKFD